MTKSFVSGKKKKVQETEFFLVETISQQKLGNNLRKPKKLPNFAKIRKIWQALEKKNLKGRRNEFPPFFERLEQKKPLRKNLEKNCGKNCRNCRENAVINPPLKQTFWYSAPPPASACKPQLSRVPAIPHL